MAAFATSKGYIDWRGASGMGVEQLELGAISTMFEDKICAVDFCEGAAVASLAQQDFCLNHFIDLCYENLQRIDTRGRKQDRVNLDPALLRAFIEECSRRALEVALHCDDITNLQRGRLLDILLWAGELFLLLRAPTRGFADSLLEEHNPVLTRLAARHF
jgi:hypothetical protein